MSDSVSVGDYPYSPNTAPIAPWPQYTPPRTVWVYPPQFFTPNWELAAAKAYEAMEAYYKALTVKLEADAHPLLVRETGEGDIACPTPSDAADREGRTEPSNPGAGSIPAEGAADNESPGGAT